MSLYDNILYINYIDYILYKLLYILYIYVYIIHQRTPKAFDTDRVAFGIAFCFDHRFDNDRWDHGGISF